MSIQAAVLRFYLRRWVKPRMGPGATVAQRRENFEKLARRMPAPPASVRSERVDAGGVPAVRVTAAGADERRALLYVHGGGLVAGSPESHRDLTWRLSAAAGCPVLVVAYRLAPEHPFPASIDDIATAYRWLLSKGHSPGALAIAGDSAGGCLMLAALVKLRDEGTAMPAAAWAVSPLTDLAATGESLKTNRAADPMMQGDSVAATAALYLGPDSPPRTAPLVSPLYADHRGLPPTLLQVGSTEVLLDDSRRLAGKLREAGVPVELRVWRDMPHAWPTLAALLPEGRAAIAEAGRFLAERMTS
jgi:acetyl esterase/lipase